jgi:hypothetical protein
LLLKQSALFTSWAYLFIFLYFVLKFEWDTQNSPPTFAACGVWRFKVHYISLNNVLQVFIYLYTIWIVKKIQILYQNEHLNIKYIELSEKAFLHFQDFFGLIIVQGNNYYNLFRTLFHQNLLRISVWRGGNRQVTSVLYFSCF